ncbi:MAG: leucine-rich repeat protein [Lachnospiraceae bacterium]|nr:leucine-rich repeat protein [Lachnospiraceae bacterium]
MVFFKRFISAAVIMSLALTATCSGSYGSKKLAKASENGAGNTVSKKVLKAEEDDVEYVDGSITIDGNNIKADNVNGLTYKGFGFLSSNSTSDLLLDYKYQNPDKYAELMNYLFGGENPLMTHVKIEMGNDRNNSTGAEAATKRTKDEVTNILRNSGWQIAADAKKINPDVKVSILRWEDPAWATTVEDRYLWYKEAILAAYEKFGYMIDYLNPNYNEKWDSYDGDDGMTDVDNTKAFYKLLQAEDSTTIPDATELSLYKKIKFVISDQANTVNANIYPALKADEEFYNATSVIGYHYTPEDDANGSMKLYAEEDDKEVWVSEAQATFSNTYFRPSNNVKDPSVAGTGIGGVGSCLEMGNTFIKSFFLSRRSHVIYQPVVGSFYEGCQYSYKELVSARDPWSGYMHYDTGLLILAHLAKFAKTGWENETNTNGIWRAIPESTRSTANGTNPVNGRNGGDNYITLGAPDKSAFSTVIVNDSEYTKTYEISVSNMNMTEGANLYAWETRAADDGAYDENYMNNLGALSYADGKYTVEVKPYSCVTVTSLDKSGDEEVTKELPEDNERTVLDTDSTGDVQNTEDGYLYTDDFEYAGKQVYDLDSEGKVTTTDENYIDVRGGETGAIARYTNTLNGAFEVYKKANGNHVLRQQIDSATMGLGNAWRDGDAATLIGDYRWTNYSASVDVLFEGDTGSPYAALTIRQADSTQEANITSGYTLRFAKSGKWTLYRAGKRVLSGTLEEGDYSADVNTWNTLKLTGNGNVITAYINGKELGSYEDENPITSGRVALGSKYTFTEFDNLSILKINGKSPYYTEYVDNMETYDLTDEKNPKLLYEGDWAIANGKGMGIYQRSTSETTSDTASVTYTAKSTGIDLLGYIENPFALKVTIDGEVVEEDLRIEETNYMSAYYSISGLEYKEHTYKFEVGAGSGLKTTEVDDAVFILDSIGIHGEVFTGEVPADPEQASEEMPASPSVEPSASADPSASTDPSASAAPSASTDPSASADPSASDNPSASPVAPAKGTVITASTGKYVITGANTAAYKAPKKNTITSATVAATVSYTKDGVTYKYKVTAINAKAFAKCKKLKKVTIGKNVQQIKAKAFFKVKTLKTIVIKSTVLKKVGSGAIKGIYKKAVIKCNKKKKAAYKKLFKKSTGFTSKMKIK